MNPYLAKHEWQSVRSGIMHSVRSDIIAFFRFYPNRKASRARLSAIGRFAARRTMHEKDHA